MKKKTNQENTATIQEGHLILSLPESNNPVLWRKDLSEIGSATFEIKKEKDNFSLILKPKKGTSEKISSFDDKDAALSALNIASQALLNGESKTVKNTSQSNDTSSKKGFPKWAIILLILLGLILLYAYSIAQMPNRIEMGNSAAAPTTTGNTAPAPQTGVPLSADDFLNGM